MTNYTYTYLLFSLLLLCTPFARTQSTVASSCVPKQIHLSFGDLYSTSSRVDDLRLPSEVFNDNQAYLVWLTEEYCEFNIYLFNENKPSASFTSPVTFNSAYSYDFAQDQDVQNPGLYKAIAYTYLFDNLDYETKYQYEITDSQGSTLAGPFNFVLTAPNVTTNPRKILLVGDIDNTVAGNTTIERLTSETINNPNGYAGMIQVGNVAYSIQDGNGTNGDNFFQSIQDITARIPFIMTPGDQAAYDDWNFLSFRLRNPMFNMTKNQYFSFNLQGIHFVSINFDFYAQSDLEVQEEIYSWAQRDLAQANDPVHRALWPWVIVISHESVYCMSSTTSNLSSVCNIQNNNMGQWDELFHQNAVDLMVSGHSSTYQRIGPIYKNQTIPNSASSQDSDNYNFTDPVGTIYIFEGTSGNKGDVSNTDGNVVPGYGALYAVNDTSGYMRLTYEHYNSETGKMTDFMNIIKTNKPVDVIQGKSYFFTIIEILIGATIVIGGLFIGIRKWRQRQVADDKIPLNTSPLRSSRLRYNRPGENGVKMVDLVMC